MTTPVYRNFVADGNLSSSSINNGTLAQSIDGDVASYYGSYDAGGDTWWKLTLTTAKKLKRIRLHPSNTALSGANFGIKDWTIYGSNDDTNWTSIATGQHANSATWQEVDITNSVAYKYYKFVCTNWHTGTSASTLIGEIELYEITNLGIGEFFQMM